MHAPLVHGSVEPAPADSWGGEGDPLVSPRDRAVESPGMIPDSVGSNSVRLITFRSTAPKQRQQQHWQGQGQGQGHGHSIPKKYSRKWPCSHDPDKARKRESVAKGKEGHAVAAPAEKYRRFLRPVRWAVYNWAIALSLIKLKLDVEEYGSTKEIACVSGNLGALAHGFLFASLLGIVGGTIGSGIAQLYWEGVVPKRRVAGLIFAILLASFNGILVLSLWGAVVPIIGGWHIDLTCMWSWDYLYVQGDSVVEGGLGFLVDIRSEAESAADSALDVVA